MRTLDEMIEYLEHNYEVDELVDMLDIPADVFLERFDDYVEQRMDYLNEELFDAHG